MGRPTGNAEAQRRDHHWYEFLETSFRENRPWDAMVRDLILARPAKPEQRGLVQFLYERQNNPQAMAEAVTNDLGGAGLFGVEFFLCGDPADPEVVFSELSPRPHDTGLVTLVGQNLSEFELHLRAVLGLPIPAIRSLGPAASRVILAQEAAEAVVYEGLERALAIAETQVLLFGKPDARPQRRMGVALARGTSEREARDRADQAAAGIAVRSSRRIS
jgi:phosphoribosylglycinamide formyltransferase 2